MALMVVYFQHVPIGGGQFGPPDVRSFYLTNPAAGGTQINHQQAAPVAHFQANHASIVDAIQYLDGLFTQPPWRKIIDTPPPVALAGAAPAGNAPAAGS